MNINGIVSLIAASEGQEQEAASERRAKICLSMKRRSKHSRTMFGAYFEHARSIFGLCLECLDHASAILGPCFGHSGTMFGPCSDHILDCACLMFTDILAGNSSELDIAKIIYGSLLFASL
jgi:hypothetical protein